ncbi:DoxX family protein [Pokkaliibacter plantistimulans]|uniref:DoxX family protein n=1 Tax=Proteobacteria bacterium 228 TaxID=2083153 RepID=A0A2S5KQY8_9PROT|nr:DoxX-like family protein [Pokkaliibacter plantistimulans]PPC77113.1 DoxX family protein [Pokkaliibacter plantistimulans]
MNRSLAAINFWSRLTLGIIFIYQGLIPKLMYNNATERMLIDAHRLTDLQLGGMGVVQLAGAAEIVLGFCILLFHRSAWPLLITCLLMLGLLIDVMMVAPALMSEAFNPLVTNLAIFFLAVIGMISNQRRPAPGWIN